MSRGAWRCLNALRWYARGNSECWPKQATLAKKLGCGLRTVKRHIEELRGLGLVTSTQRPNSSCKYLLSTGLSTEMALPNGTPGGTPTIKLSELKVLNHSKRAPMTDNTFPRPEASKLRTIIEICGFVPTTEILAKLKRKADFYAVTGFVVVAHIDRAWRKVQGTSDRPRSIGWIFAVVENACKLRDVPIAEPEAKPMARAAAAHNAPDAQGRYFGPTEIDIAALAEGKRMIR